MTGTAKVEDDDWTFAGPFMPRRGEPWSCLILLLEIQKRRCYLGSKIEGVLGFFTIRRTGSVV